eukprot:CAMPEP_0181229066 /NCGR_PEP_ID=MMETSP1096-20121128/33691_1 /TAXON_ID=156174 ORGANISM="Chrysochromulina ericina, Strain CCMP281" /NCGR_SAMPLE_ID=MMETSP1096 /ASSEMBLY_ACC=CAM_ASM_000453 /LENGTH=109 /DNA_ID=CAMNT_0023322649 /DNA_START=29 /DNA_END=361 /DNA_ORIENTATION=+
MERGRTPVSPKGALVEQTAQDAQVAHASPTLAEEGCIPPPSSVHTSLSTASCSGAAVGDTHVTHTHGTVGWHCRARHRRCGHLAVPVTGATAANAANVAGIIRERGVDV